MAIYQKFRGDGTTTKQMMAASRDSLFVWCNGQLDYPRRLAKKHGREDLEIVSPEWLEDGRWQGRWFTGMTIDHATVFTEKQYDAAQQVNCRIRTSESEEAKHG